MSGKLTTHVLDLSRGTPAAGMSLQLWRISPEGKASILLHQAVTNSDGRLDAPLLAGEGLLAGSYELLFMAGDYFRSAETALGAASAESGSLFLEQIPIRFNILDPAEHYHVPLLVAPGGYNTYRGS